MALPQRCILIMLCMAPLVSQSLSSEQEHLVDKLFKLDLQELLTVEITTASNTPEQLSNAPATVILLTKHDIKKRGYNDLTELFDDLPGMDVVRAYGDVNYKNYWRGYRSDVGFPFLVMIDGIVLNTLYYNEAEVLVAYPLSNIRQVEVVYGPASSVYGPNAFMGVVNIITQSDQWESGSYFSGKLSKASFDTRIVDFTYFYKKEDFRLSFSTRFDTGNMDRSVNNSYEYTKDKYYADSTLWGGFIKNSNLGGAYSSPHKHRAFDFRAYLGKSEFALQYLVQETGYGNEYPADQVQNHAVWREPSFSAHFRHINQVTETIRSSSLFRFQQTGVDKNSYFVYGGGNPRGAYFSYWQLSNHLYAVFQDFDIVVNEALSLNTGIKFEYRNLYKSSRNMSNTNGPFLPPEEIDPAIYPFPSLPNEGERAQNRNIVESEGIYIQGRYQFAKLIGFDDPQILNFGIRFDTSSQFEDVVTLRGGLVSHFDKLTFKLLYGEAFQEPVPRVLYGGWKGSGSDPNLQPETSQTLETSLSYTEPEYSVTLNMYRILNENTIRVIAGSAKNLGEREILGFDLHSHIVFEELLFDYLKVWGYYSYIESTEQQFNHAGDFTKNEPIGDLAGHKLWLGTTAHLNNEWIYSLFGRYVDTRKTVKSNPVRTVGSFITVDFNVRYSPSPVSIELKIKNLFDERYFHPGIRSADAGTTPGAWKDGISGGTWEGSKGFFNSLLPQPGRSVAVSLVLDF